MKQIFTLIVFVMLGVSAIPGGGAVPPTFDAKCRVPSLPEAIKEARAIFRGKVVGVTEEGSVKTFEFKVERYWKGVKTRKVFVNASQNVRYEPWFQVGQRYLVYASRGDDGKLWENRCSTSKRVEDAAPDYKLLGRGKVPNK